MRTAGTLLVLCLFAAVPWALYTTALENTLHAHPTWRSAKVDCEKGVIGSIASTVSRVMLHGNRLDLGSWFGHHEIYTAEPVAMHRVRCRVRLEEGAHVSVLIDEGGVRFDRQIGFRLSRNGAFPSAFVALDETRSFRTHVPFVCRRLDVDGWHDVELRFEEPGNVQLAVDGTVLFTRAGFAPRTARVGFRGSGRSTLVDDVQIFGPGDPDRTPPHVDEGFDRHDALPIAWAGWVGALGALAWIVHASGRARMRRAGRRPALLPAAALLLAGIFGSGVFVLDRVWLGDHYPEDMRAVPAGVVNTLYGPEVDPKPWSERFPDKAELPRLRVLFVGGSQTWGSGATHANEVWTRVVERRLNAAFPDRAVECINRARSGAKIDEMVAGLTDSWLASIDPHVVVADHGFNDRDPAAFGQGLVGLWTATTAHGARLVLIAEPVCSESRPPHLAVNHHVMHELAGDRVPVLDLQDTFDARRNSGFHWWDPVHMTSAGQALMAELVSERLIELLSP